MDGTEGRYLYDHFLPRLVEAWDSRSVGSGHVDDDRYVQWAGYGLGLQIECVSNRFLSGASRLTQLQIDELRRRGWHDPLGNDLPNHWQVFVNRAEVHEAALALADAVHLLRSPSAMPRPVEPRRAKAVVVVPVGKLGMDDVHTAALGAVRGTSDAVVIDLFGLASYTDLGLPTASVAAVLEAGEQLTYPVLVDTGLRFTDEPLESLLPAAGELLGVLRQLRVAGREVVVVGPRLFPDYQWLYAATLRAAAEAVVLVLGEAPDESLPAELLGVVLAALEGMPQSAVVPAWVAPERLHALGGAQVVVATEDVHRTRDSVSLLVRAMCEGRAPDAMQIALRGGLPSLPRTAAGKHDEGVHMLDSRPAGLHHLAPGTVCHSRTEFAQLLGGWLQRPDRDRVVGEPSSFGARPVVRIRVGGRAFHLNGDTRDSGVRAYLRLVDQQGTDLAWHVVANVAGRINKVAVGDPPARIRHFYLYADEVSAEPYAI